MRLGFALLFSGLLYGQAQPAAQDKCRLEGKIVNSVSGQPVRKARVIARSMAAPGGGRGGRGQVGAVIAGVLSAGPLSQNQLTAVTDADGHFAFAVDPGRYMLDVQRDGFQRENTQPFGAPMSRAGPYTVAAGADKRDVLLRLEPLGIVAGRVRDEEGDPVRNVQIALMAYQYTARGRELMQRSGTTTNDLGEYRMFDVPAGKYYLRAMPRAAVNFSPGGDPDPETLATAYFPGAPDASGATAIDVRPGQESGNTDMMLRRTRTVAVRGHVVKPAGTANYYSSVMVTQSSGITTSMTGSGMTDPNGNFNLRLAPGSYELSWQVSVENKRWVARLPIQVGAGDLEGLELRPEAPVEVKGVFRVEGNTPFQNSRLRAYLQGSNNRGSGNTSAPKEDGSFSIRDVEPGSYTVNVNLPPDLFVKSIRCGSVEAAGGSIDITSAPCDLAITLSSNGGEIEGSVDLGEQPAEGIVVSVVPAGSRRDATLFRASTTKPDGGFDFKSLAPGEYRVYAWQFPVDYNELRFNPDFYKPYESMGQSVQVSEGGKQTLTLKPIVKPAVK